MISLIECMKSCTNCKKKRTEHARHQNKGNKFGNFFIIRWTFLWYRIKEIFLTRFFETCIHGLTGIYIFKFVKYRSIIKIKCESKKKHCEIELVNILCFTCYKSFIISNCSIQNPLPRIENGTKSLL